VLETVGLRTRCDIGWRARKDRVRKRGWMRTRGWKETRPTQVQATPVFAVRPFASARRGWNGGIRGLTARTLACGQMEILSRRHRHAPPGDVRVVRGGSAVFPVQSVGDAGRSTQIAHSLGCRSPCRRRRPDPASTPPQPSRRRAAPQAERHRARRCVRCHGSGPDAQEADAIDSGQHTAMIRASEHLPDKEGRRRQAHTTGARGYFKKGNGAVGAPDRAIS
jgi:hypothetical protein